MATSTILALAVGLMLVLGAHSRDSIGFTLGTAPFNGPYHTRALQSSLARDFRRVTDRVASSRSSSRFLLAASGSHPLRRALLQSEQGDAAAENGAPRDANATETESWDPMLLDMLRAAREEDMDAVMDYMAEGGDPMAKGPRGWGAVHEAAWDCNREMLDYFIEKAGADVNERTERGVTLVMDVAMRGCLGLLRYLVEDLGANVTAVDDEGWSALHHAAAVGAPASVIEYLTEQGLDVNAQTNAGQTPFMLAVRVGGEGTAEALIEAGDESHGDPSIVDEEGSTALHYTGLIPLGGMKLFDDDGKADLVPLIVEAGIPVNARDDRNATALMYAAYNDLPAVVDALLVAGADPDLTDNRGNSAMGLARRHGFLEIMDMLQAA